MGGQGDAWIVWATTGRDADLDAGCLVNAPATPVDERPDANAMRRLWDLPAVVDPPRRTRSDWLVVAFTLLLGVGEAISSGLGWPTMRAGVALVVAGVLLLRRKVPLAALVMIAAITLAAGITLRIAEHYLLVSGLMFTVAIYALVRWASGRHIVVGSGVIVVHAIGGQFIDPNSSVGTALIFYVTPMVLAYVVRLQANPSPEPRPVRMPGRVWRSTGFRCFVVVAVAMGLFAVTQRVFMADQIASYVTHTRSPAAPAEWLVDATVLRRAAETSQGTHDSDGAVRHVVDYPSQMLEALESPTWSAEADVTVIDGTGFLQHDPKDAVGLPLLEFLEYATIAGFPIIKLDLKRDRVDLIVDEVQQAVDRFGLDPRHLQFNADVFRGPDVVNNAFGARTDLSFTDSMYNLIAMELETSDLIYIAYHLPESTIAISATTPTGPREEGYSEDHLDHFLSAATEIREVNPRQPLVFVVRGDLAVRSGAFLLQGLTSVEGSHVAAWWSADVPPATGEIETLQEGGVTFFDPGDGGHG